MDINKNEEIILDETYKPEVITGERFNLLKKMMLRYYLIKNIFSSIIAVILLICSFYILYNVIFDTIVMWTGSPTAIVTSGVLGIIGSIVLIKVIKNITWIAGMSETNISERVIVFKTYCNEYIVDRKVQWVASDDGSGGHEEVTIKRKYKVDKLDEIINILYNRYGFKNIPTEFSPLFDIHADKLNGGIKGENEEVYVVGVIDRKSHIKELGVVPITFDWKHSKIINENEKYNGLSITKRVLTGKELVMYNKLCVENRLFDILHIIKNSVIFTLLFLIIVRFVFGVSIITGYAQHELDNALNLLQRGDFIFEDYLFIMKVFSPYIMLLVILIITMCKIIGVFRLQSGKVISEIMLFEDICVDTELNEQNPRKSKYRTSNISGIVNYLNEHYDYKIKLRSLYIKGFKSTKNVKIVGASESVYVMVVKKHLYVVPKDFTW